MVLTRYGSLSSRTPLVVSRASALLAISNLFVLTVAAGENINFDIKVIHGYRKFCNKIYQAAKYVLGKLGDDFVPYESATAAKPASLAERWILHKLSAAARDINQALTEREFQRSTSIVYQFWYNHLCDVYIVSGLVV